MASRTHKSKARTTYALRMSHPQLNFANGLITTQRNGWSSILGIVLNSRGIRHYENSEYLHYAETSPLFMQPRISRATKLLYCKQILVHSKYFFAESQQINAAHCAPPPAFGCTVSKYFFLPPLKKTGKTQAMKWVLADPT